MARKTYEKATATISGVVAEYYAKGKKYDYVTIDVHHDYDKYYDRFKVAVNKSFICPDYGEPISVDCTNPISGRMPLLAIAFGTDE